MVRISDGDIQSQWSKVQSMAIAEPVTITHHGQDYVVLLSAKEYDRLKRRDRRVMTLADFTADDITVLKTMRAPAEAAAFDHEVKD